MSTWRAVPILVRMTWRRWAFSIGPMGRAAAAVLALVVAWAVVEDYAFKRPSVSDEVEKACRVLVTDTEGVWVEPLVAGWSGVPCTPVREVPGGGTPEEALADGRLTAWVAFDATSVAKGAVRVVVNDELPWPLDFRLDDHVTEVVVRETVERAGLTAARAQALATRTVWEDARTGAEATPKEFQRGSWNEFSLVLVLSCLPMAVAFVLGVGGSSRSNTQEILGTPPAARWVAEATNGLLRFVVVLLVVVLLGTVKAGVSAVLALWYGAASATQIPFYLPDTVSILRLGLVVLLTALALTPLAPSFARSTERTGCASKILDWGVVVVVWPLTVGICTLLNLEIPGSYGLGCFPVAGFSVALFDAPSRFETMLLGPAAIGSALAGAWVTFFWFAMEGRPGWGERL